jgi:hypothetical protein
MAFSFCSDDSRQPKAETATKRPNPLKAFAIRRQDAVSLQIGDQKLPTLTLKMISTIIFMDNLFKMAYVSVTRNSCGRGLADLVPSLPGTPAAWQTTKDSQADSCNSGVDSSCPPTTAGTGLAFVLFMAYALFPLYQ